MSEELKSKLFNYEVNPPDTTWARISAALDDEVNAEFPDRLYEAQVAPPSESWNKIVSVLGTGVQEEYPAKLYNLEVIPPIGTWDKISEAINEDRSLPVTTDRRKMVPVVRYLVAASFVGVLAFGVIKLVNQKSVNHSVAGTTVTPQKISPGVIQPESQKISAEQSIPATANNLPNEKATLAKGNTVPRKKSARDQVNQIAYVTQTAELVSNVNAQAVSNFQHASLRGEVPGNCPFISDADRYLNFMDPDGALIRVSKKLADAVGCFYSNGNADEYKQCQEQIKRWRDKINQSPSTPSADHFMDILDMLKSVQDNEL